ncbi:sulfate transporter [Salmonella enterica]|uniref:Sulfate transporter n=1 Tax=Salmonella enterica TaxID=28901 RepID=A0A7D8IHS6_SALER|nr:sulfate transporter [Salmonella enterica]
MTPQLTWTREADTLVLAGELDQDVLAPLWDARVEAMNGVYPYRPEPDLQGRYGGTGAAGAPCEPGKKAGQCRVAVWR